METRGRPTKYTDDMPNKADEYLAQSNDEWTEFHKTRGERSDSYERIVKVKLPSHERFAEFIGVNTTTLYEWEKEYPEFSKALVKILQEQKNRLVEEGLANNYNPTIAKLVLSSNHGMREGTDLTSGGKKIEGTIVYLPKQDV